MPSYETRRPLFEGWSFTTHAARTGSFSPSPPKRVLRFPGETDAWTDVSCPRWELSVSVKRFFPSSSQQGWDAMAPRRHFCRGETALRNLASFFQLVRKEAPVAAASTSQGKPKTNEGAHFFMATGTFIFWAALRAGCPCTAVDDIRSTRETASHFRT